MKLRINKLISEALSCSRRDADEYIKDGRVKINGKVAQLSDNVEENDIVLFDLVDLPTKDLIRQSAADSKQEEYENQGRERKKKKSRGDERAESQRIQASPKSAALRNTSKNNPENKIKKMRKHSWEDDDIDEVFGKKGKAKNKGFENKGKKPFKPSRKSSYMDFDDDF